MIVIPLIPKPAPRPRFSRNGTHNPKDYTQYKKTLLMLAYKQDKGYFEGAIKLEVTFYMPIPKSLSKKKQSELIGQYHIKKSDLDNLIKTVKDSLEGTYFKNDSQICEIVARKVYAVEPRTEFELSSQKGH